MPRFHATSKDIIITNFWYATLMYHWDKKHKLNTYILEISRLCAAYNYNICRAKKHTSVNSLSLADSHLIYTDYFSDCLADDATLPREAAISSHDSRWYTWRHSHFQFIAILQDIILVGAELFRQLPGRLPHIFVIFKMSFISALFEYFSLLCLPSG